MFGIKRDRNVNKVRIIGCVLIFNVRVYDVVCSIQKFIAIFFTLHCINEMSQIERKCCRLYLSLPKRLCFCLCLFVLSVCLSAG